jgi:hypothetical protein
LQLKTPFSVDIDNADDNNDEKCYSGERCADYNTLSNGAGSWSCDVAGNAGKVHVQLRSALLANLMEMNCETRSMGRFV